MGMPINCYSNVINNAQNKSPDLKVSQNKPGRLLLPTLLSTIVEVTNEASEGPRSNSVKKKVSFDLNKNVYFDLNKATPNYMKATISSRAKNVQKTISRSEDHDLVPLPGKKHIYIKKQMLRVHIRNIVGL